jgi:hypothetical protein
MKVKGLNMDKVEKIMLAGFIGFVIIALIYCCLQPYFEAKTFNKFSDTKATYWDAVFAELRVMPKNN